MATTPKPTDNSLVLAQSVISKGFKLLDGLSDAKLLEISDYVNSYGGHGKRKANNNTQHAYIVGHSLPVTHVEGSYIASKLLDIMGQTNWSSNTIIHSTQYNTPRVIKAKNGEKSRYSAEWPLEYAAHILRCATHNRGNRSECSNMCAQGFANAEGKYLYATALKRKFTFATSKPSKAKKAKGKGKGAGKGKGKPAVKAAKAPKANDTDALIAKGATILDVLATSNVETHEAE